MTGAVGSISIRRRTYHAERFPRWASICGDKASSATPTQVQERQLRAQAARPDHSNVLLDPLRCVLQCGYDWRSWEHLDPAKDVITAVQDKRSEWTHGNAVMELPDGNLLVSFRDISTIIKIKRRTGQILWKMGVPPLSGQHAPTPLPNGNILIFDNGPHRCPMGIPSSMMDGLDGFLR
jgi:Arylsulfotransferase (ASST)